ncbi:MAG: fibro-slime domain-containing protein [Oscillospiraceae bacterium]|nr:fibro-slime domain-containing protein [Oscillospiraceae bacterium]
MNKSVDTFVSEVKSKQARRRRMMSLLLALSLVVTTGVSWALHGVGLTMANEAECETEEHIHTDACYEERLICGLEEDAEHTHSDECWERTLICGLTEHIHDADCYTGRAGPEITAEEPDSAGDDDDVVIGGIVDADGHVIQTVSVPKKALRAPGDPEIPLDTVSTIDNIAEGIKFTLFDYGGSELESQNNRYVYSWDEDNHVWTHPQSYNSSDFGWRDSGINTGRDPATDILFFAMGTPVDRYCQDPDVYNYWDDNGVHQYKPDMNSYAGDYNSDPVYPGNRPVTGIVDTTLGEDGYPKIASSGNSLAYLFAPGTYDAERNVDQSAYKTVYTDVNHLLQRNTENGHLFYDSDKYYAYFNTDTKEFDVYNQTFEIINDNHHWDGDTNNIKFDGDGNPIVYEGNKDEGFKIGFFPFDEYDPTRRDPNFDGNGYNHHFGMTMEAEFINPSKANVSEPITFKYSGDDDMWVFVDGKLLLDIGGIHEPAGGMIDFTNGIIWTQDNGNDGKTKSEIRTQLENWGIIHNDTEWNDLPMPIGIDTSSFGESKWIVKKISDVIPNWDSTAHTKSHKINMFYLERGGCYSNLAMEMNLPTLKPLTVMKNVDYQQHLIKGLYDDLDYTFQIWEWDKVNQVWVIPQDTDENGDFYLPESHFTLKDGQRKTFEGLGQDRKFKVVEEGVNPNIFDRVTVNGSPIDVAEGQAATEGALLSAVNSYTFNNRIIEETTPLRVKKLWSPDNIQPPPGFDKVKFKIMRTDVETGEEKQIGLQQGDIKVRTFVISADEWAEGKTIEGLLSRYGSHRYTYSVVELNVPRGFKPSYSTDASGALVITNKDEKKTDIYAEKQWENEENPPRIKLKLTRTKTGYKPSKPTQLTINIVDEAENPILTYTSPAQTAGTPYNGLYAGGTAEFAYVIPKGAVLCEPDGTYPIASPAGLYYKFHEDEGILEVRDLGADANTLTFKVNTSHAEDSILLEHHSFSDDSIETGDGKVQGWSVQNDPSKGTDAKVRFDDSLSYGKDGGALEVYDRTKSFNGATLVLDPAKFHGNVTYTFSVYVYSPVADRFKMTFNNGLGAYQPIREVDVPANTWTQITSTIKLGEGQDGQIDPYNMFIIVESVGQGDDGESLPSGGDHFWIDEFTALEGTNPVSVSSTDGKVTIGEAASSQGTVVYDFQFQNNDSSEGWNVMDFTPPNNTTIEPGSNYWFQGIVVTGRNAHNDGISIRVPNLVPGKTYHFEGVAQEHAGTSAQTIQLSMNTGTGQYPPIVQNIHLNEDSGNSWEEHFFEADFTVPAGADQNTMSIYFETPQPQNGAQADTGDFRLKYLTITEKGQSSSSGTLNDEIGYDESTGQYVTDYSNYRIVLDENSPTSPQLEDDEPQADDWYKEIILPDDSDDGASWSYHWTNDAATPRNDPHFIDEDHAHFYYNYYIEETWIDSEGNELHQDESDGNWYDADGRLVYRVTYLNDGIRTNDPDSPIIVKNTYIWYRLPETGGFGADVIFGFGLLLAMTGLIGGYALQKRERRFK